MGMTVHCDVITAQEQVFDGLVEMVVVPGAEGDLGVTPGHAALMTPIKPGPIRMIEQGGKETALYVSGGYIEVQPDRVTVLADTVMREEDLDEKRILAAREDARKAALSGATNEGDFDSALAQLESLVGQVRALEAIRKAGRR